MASSTDYATAQFNIAADGHRQPGSAFKPFVLATALKQGINPDKTFYNGSSPITLYPYGREGEPWTVNNAEPGEGRMSVIQATTDSVNAVYAQLDLDVGPENVAATAHSLGITSPLTASPPRASAACASACPRWRCRTPTRPSPTAASTTARRRSTGSTSRDASIASARRRRARALAPALAAEETRC